MTPSSLWRGPWRRTGLRCQWQCVMALSIDVFAVHRYRKSRWGWSRRSKLEREKVGWGKMGATRLVAKAVFAPGALGWRQRLRGTSASPLWRRPASWQGVDLGEVGGGEVSLTNRQRNFREQFARLQEGSQCLHPRFANSPMPRRLGSARRVNDMVNRLKAHGGSGGERLVCDLRATERALGL